jgi:replicative DNA helicase
VPSAGNIRRYAEIVRERSLLRQLVAASDKIATGAFNTQGKAVEAVLEEAQQTIFAIAESRGAARDEWDTPDDSMVQFLEGVQSRADGKTDFLPFGIDELDERLDGGGRPGEVVVIAARPGMGKTALALTISEHVAEKHGAAVGVFSMEMPRPQVHTRRVAMHSRVPLHKLKRPERMSEFDWSEMARAVDKIRTLPVYVSDQTALTINQLRSKARSLKRRKGLRLLIVDYIGLMEGTDRKANRATQLGEVSRGIKALAKELGVTVLLLAQLNREVEKRPNMRPIMADLRECGDIEQDADVILFVHRPVQVKPDLGPEWKHYAEIIIGKQRDGVNGVVHAQYVGECVRFSSWPEGMEIPTSAVRGSSNL